MKRESLRKTFIARAFEKAARRAGAQIVLNGDYGCSGQLLFPNGTLRYFHRAHFDINPHGAFEVVKYKNYTNHFLEQLGYPTVPGMTFFTDDFARELGSARDVQAAYRWAQSNGFPVIVKPNSKGQGLGVACVYNKRDFHAAVREIFKMDKVGLVQQFVAGRDYRVVALDGRVISAFERRPLEVVGDGQSTIAELVAARRQWSTEYRDLPFRTDYRLAMNLRRLKLKLESVPAIGVRVPLLHNANVSSGGVARDVLRKMHPKFRRIAVDVTRKLGLRLAGVDLIVQGNIREAPGTYWVLELNAAPSLDNYAGTRSRRGQVLQRLFVKVIKAMESGSSVAGFDRRERPARGA
jgi:D-alanine-D-alanine ligase-like ATP-grasp enzyme